MDANGLLAVVAILIAIFTMLAEEKKLDFKLRLTWVDWLVFISLTMIVLYAVYLPVLEHFKLNVSFSSNYGFDKSTVILTTLIVMIGHFLWKLRQERLPVSRLNAWKRVSMRLLREKKYYQLSFLLDKYHEHFIEAIVHKSLLVKLHEFVNPDKIKPIAFSDIPSMGADIVSGQGGSPQLGDSELPVKQDKKTPEIYVVRFLCRYVFGFFSGLLSRVINAVSSLINSFRRLLAKCLPVESKASKLMQESLSDLLKSKQFVAHFSETHPLTAAEFSSASFGGNDEYTQSFFTSLVSNQGSVLYRELRDNQNCSHTGEYYLDESNSLLYYFLSDVENAVKVGIWKPIGDFVDEFIQSQKGKDNYYNQPCGRFSSGEEKWSCPIFVGGYFFRVMVSAAIFQRTKSHMWLMYCDSFVGEMLTSLDRSDDVDINNEFPSKFDYLLYELFASCSTWVGAVEYVDVSADDYMDYPEYWAAKKLGSMLKKIVLSQKMTHSQKVYFLQIAIRRMKRLDLAEQHRYSSAIMDGCIRQYEDGAVETEMVDLLSEIYRDVDHVLKSRKSTFETVLAEVQDECSS